MHRRRVARRGGVRLAEPPGHRRRPGLAPASRILRAYRSYRQRIGSRFTEGYQNDVLAANPARHGQARAPLRAALRPRASRATRTAEAGAARGDPRRPRRGRLARPRPHPAQPARLIDATLRTNAYRPGRERRSPSSCARPTCRRSRSRAPLFEIYVYSPAMEGIHLRGGRIARGGHPLVGPHGLPHRGLRADARADDQERGHRPRRAPRAASTSRPRPADPAALQGRGRAPVRAPTSAACSTSPTTSSTARSCTPTACACSTSDDTYLVVAADKGTATFSDTANRVAERAAASGSATRSPPAARRATTTRRSGSPRAARGSRVKRHFRELDLDPARRRVHRRRHRRHVRRRVRQRDAAVATSIRLVAAYDHRHVFIDPDPDPARRVRRAQAAVRARRAPRGTTTTARAISEGGGVWPRSAKSIPLSAAGARRARDRGRSALHAQRGHPRDPARAGRPALERRHRHGGQGLDRDRRRRAWTAPRTPSASTPPSCAAASWARAATSASPSARGSSSRAAAACVNADFIDNSAGVDCSDHEVNLKILLDLAVRARRARRAAERDALLRAVTDDVVDARPLRLLPAGADPRRRRSRVSRGRMYAYEDLMTALEADGPARPRGRGAADGRGDGRAPARGPRPGAARAGACCSPTPSAR